MSDLKPTGTKIRLGKNEYALRFTLNVIDDIQDHFNIPIEEMEKLFKDEKNAIKNLRYLLAVLINEDIDCQNDEALERGEKPRLLHVDERYVGRYISAENMNEMTTSIYKSFAAGTPEPEEDAPNATSEQQND